MALHVSLSLLTAPPAPVCPLASKILALHSACTFLTGMLRNKVFCNLLLRYVNRTDDKGSLTTWDHTSLAFLYTDVTHEATHTQIIDRRTDVFSHFLFSSFSLNCYAFNHKPKHLMFMYHILSKRQVSAQHSGLSTVGGILGAGFLLPH